MRWVVFASAAAIALVMLASLLKTAPDITRVYTLPCSWAIAMVIGAAAYLSQDALARLLPQSRVPRAALSLLSLAVISATPANPNGPLLSLPITLPAATIS